MPIKMVAKEKFRYPFLGPHARELEPGDEFEVKEVDDLAEQKTALALRLAERATEVPVEKRKYNRRDMRAVDPD